METKYRQQLVHTEDSDPHVMMVQSFRTGSDPKSTAGAVKPRQELCFHPSLVDISAHGITPAPALFCTNGSRESRSQETSLKPSRAALNFGRCAKGMKGSHFRYRSS